MRSRLLAACLVAALLPSVAPALDPESVARWRQDLEFARARILETHPDPFAKLTPAELDARFADLSARLPELAPHEVVVGLAEILAALGDGHTRLTLPLPDDAGFVAGHSSTPAPEDPALRFHTLPIRLGLYQDGLFIERVAAERSELAGARVTAIGGVPVEEAFERLAPVIRHDNRQQLLDLLPMHLVIPEILSARGLTRGRDRARFDLVTAAGDPLRVDLEATREEATVRWISALEGAPRLAPSLRHVIPGWPPRRGHFERENWWMTVPGTRTVYVQFNRVEDLDELPVHRLAEQVRTELASGAAERVVLDLRWNWGGDNSLNLPLLHALISSPGIRAPAGLVVLVGRGTFSAAMMFAVDLEHHLRPLFVGEPTGSTPNHFGDSRKQQLPNSGLTLRISTLWHQLSGPNDERVAIAPHLEVPPSWSDLIAGRDRALEIALGPPSPVDELTGELTGRLSVPHQELAVELRGEPSRSGTGRAVLTIDGFDEPLELERLASSGSRSRWSGDSPLGPFELELVRLGDRLAGRVTFAVRPWRSFALGLTPGSRTASGAP